MGSLSELSLDFKPSYVPKTISGFLREVSMIGDCSKRLLKIEDFLTCLEEERKKIDAFKRELPFCMLLMSDAIEMVKEEEKQCRLAAEKARPVLEEFMLIKSKMEEDESSKIEKDCRDKMNWMSSAQLWSDSHDDISKNKSLDIKEKAEESERSASENLFSGCKYQSNGAFVPFKGFSGFSSNGRKEEKEVLPLPGISLASSRIKDPNADLGTSSLNSKSSSRTAVSSSSAAAAAAAANLQSNLQQQQAPRKARRCWSPELHRRFVSALQQLGGSQVATPKQIRELMKVDGLTNDEVKSHLQKYRLHTRRLPASTAASANQQVIVMGRVWAPNDHYQASKQSISQSGSPQGPLQLARAGRGISTTGGDSGEDEDRKSESYSWKGHPPRSGDEETE